MNFEINFIILIKPFFYMTYDSYSIKPKHLEKEKGY